MTYGYALINSIPANVHNVKSDTTQHKAFYIMRKAKDVDSIFDAPAEYLENDEWHRCDFLFWTLGLINESDLEKYKQIVEELNAMHLHVNWTEWCEAH